MQPPRPPARPTAHLFAAVLALSALGAVYLAKGTVHLFSTAVDFRLRWTEQQYVFRGKNPLDVWERADAEQRGVAPPATGRDGTVDLDLGPTDGGYPPWAYATGAAFFWPGREVSQALFGVLNLLLVACVGIWAYRLGRPTSPWHGALLSASVLATSSICTTLGLGQYGVVVLAALVGVYELERRGRAPAAGVLTGVALTKVTLSAPFLVPLLFRRRLATLGWAAAYVTVGSVVVWWATGTDPATMLVQMVRSAEHYAGNGYSVFDLFAALGLDAGAAIKAGALSTLAVSGVILWSWRHAPPDVGFAVAATTARLWTYHVYNDNLVMVFLLTALGTRASGSRAASVGFLVVGVTLWAPARMCDHPAFMVFQLAVWVGGTVLLLLLVPRGGAVSGREPGPAPAARG